jgi:Beta-galactosidase
MSATFAFSTWTGVTVLAAIAAVGCGNGSAGSQPGNDSGRPDSGVDGPRDAASDAPQDAPNGDAKNADAIAQSPRGVYVPTFQKAIASDSVLQQEIKEAYVDGFFLSRGWSQIETSPGTYDFTSLDQDIQTVAAAGKKATLGIGGGAQAPSWICSGTGDSGASAKCLTFVEANQAGACNAALLPLPWDPVYEAAFGKMVAALGAHILGDTMLSSTVILMKVTGLNYTDEETILPFQKGGTVSCKGGGACTAGKCVQTDALATLEAAGYTDTSATTAFLAFASDFRAAFGMLPIGSQVSGSLPSPGSDSLPLVMVEAFVGDHAVRPITVQDQGLRATSGVDPGSLYALDAGVPVGYQMYAAVYGGGANCPMAEGLRSDGGGPVTCDQAVLIDAINYGINHGGARWLEIYETDVENYPDAAIYAHSKLVSP